MAIGNTIYNALFKRTSTFALLCVGGAFFFERTFDLTCDTLFDIHNRGKLWKDIKSNYGQ